VIFFNYKSSEVNYWILMDGNYTISGSNDVLEFSIRAALAKGDLISEIISRWLKSPKQFAKHS
jgi:hypothetical protein